MDELECFINALCILMNNSMEFECWNTCGSTLFGRMDSMRVGSLNRMFENTCETSAQCTCDAATDQPNVNELVKERC